MKHCAAFWVPIRDGLYNMGVNDKGQGFRAEGALGRSDGNTCDLFVSPSPPSSTPRCYPLSCTSQVSNANMPFFFPYRYRWAGTATWETRIGLRI
jgi:hypothetical protein